MFYFPRQVCDLLSALVPEAICKSLIESQIPAIIDGLVNDNLNPQVGVGDIHCYMHILRNLNPQELCSSIGACSAPAPDTTTTIAPTEPTSGTTPTEAPAPTDAPTPTETAVSDPPTESPRLRKLL